VHERGASRGRVTMKLHRRAGQAVAEFAFVLPLFLLIMSGTIEFGRAYIAYAQLLQAAQEGARYGAVLPNTRDDAAIRTRVQQLAPGGAADTVTISSTVSPTSNTAVTASSRTRGNVLTVAIQHNQSLLVPLLPFSQFSMTVTTSMVIEQVP
jgi:Flp pilus assembly protein TadG